MLLTVYGTEWPILCWCAVKKLLTHCTKAKIGVNIPLGTSNWRANFDQGQNDDGQDPYCGLLLRLYSDVISKFGTFGK